MLKKSDRRKILKAKLDLINLQIENVHIEIIKSLLSILNLLINNQFSVRKCHEAAGRMVKIHSLSDLLGKQVEMYITHEVADIFETNAKLSFSLEDIERKKVGVFEWLSEVKQATKQFQNALRVERDPEKISMDLGRLVEKVGYDQRLSDLTNTLRAIVTESEVYYTGETMEKLTSTYNNLKLHPIIKDSSEKLFKDRYYSQAIFEAYKALNNYVKRKSKRGDLDGKDLMAKVFSFRYDPSTDSIQKKPILQLNELCSLSDRNEQEGFMHLFMGSMIGIRNPKAHDQIVQRDPFRTLMYLSFASLLAKRAEEAKLNC